MTDKFDLKLERILDAPRELVWRALTDPEHMKRWWAPRPYQTPECEIELKPGGKFYTRMTGPDGFDFSGTACILEAVPGERIIWSTTMKVGYRPTNSPTTAATASRSPRSTRSRTLAMARRRYTATVHARESKGPRYPDANGFQRRLGDLRRATCRGRARDRGRRLNQNAPDSQSSPAHPISAWLRAALVAAVSVTAMIVNP